MHASWSPYQTLDVDCSAGDRYGEGVTSPVTLKRWKRAEYDRLVDLGAFRSDPVELIGPEAASKSEEIPALVLKTILDT